MLGPDLDWELLALFSWSFLEVRGLVRRLLPLVSLEVIRSSDSEAVQKDMAMGGEERREACRRPYG